MWLVLVVDDSAVMLIVGGSEVGCRIAGKLGRQNNPVGLLVCRARGLSDCGRILVMVIGLRTANLVEILKVSVHHTKSTKNIVVASSVFLVDCNPHSVRASGFRHELFFF